MKNNNFNTQNVNGFNTNDNKNNNGDDYMKLLTKKQFKGLKKGEAYTEYLSVGELADAFRCKADKAEELFKDARKDFVEAEKDAEASKKEAAEAKKRAAEAEKRAEDAELKIAEGHGKVDAGFDLITELHNDLDELVENRNEAFGRYERLGERMGGKKNRANINTGTIRHYKNIITKCKKDIANGIDVGVNKATIIELEAEIRNLQRQVDAANGTFMEMKRNKTAVSQEITQMDAELNKRYQLNNLLGELGYI